MLNRKIEIIPTIWIQKKQEFSDLIRIFYANGIRKLRVNCTRYPVEKYIADAIFLREICSQIARNMDVILDIPYPRKKIRIDKYKGEKNIDKDDVVYLTSHMEIYEKRKNIIYTKEDLASYLGMETEVVIGDGVPNFVVNSVGSEIELCCLKGGRIISKKSITTNKLKFLSCLAKEDIEQFRELIARVSPNIIALSCVQNASEVLKAREELSLPSSVKIMVKIENEIGSENIAEISKVADYVMIARGDLLINCGGKKFIGAIERIILECEKRKCPYYMATGVLDGIVNNQPTRAELAEIFYLCNLNCKGAVIEYSKCDTPEKFLELVEYFR